MQRIEDLKISPWPWCGGWDEILDKYGFWVAKGANGDVETFENCTLLRAAPELYECLSEAIEDRCRRCKAEWYGKCVTEDGEDCEIVAKWKSVLAKAAGEVV